MVLAKAAHGVAPTEAASLALVSVIAGALGVFAIAAWARRVGAADDPPTALVAVVVAIATPLYWFTSDRPLSDVTGLAAAVGVQALILRARTGRDLAVASFCAALAVGLRSQVFWLTAPLLLWALAGRRWRAPGIVAAYLLGAAAWAIPLVVVSGGLRAYWQAVSNQGVEDLSGIRMLWTTPTVRELFEALFYAFVAPWAMWPLATAVLLLASLGAIRLWQRDRRALAIVAIGFGPYLIFDVLFQETFTSRYALPLTVPIAYLAACGARAAPQPAGWIAAIGAAVIGAHIGGVSLAGYSRQPAPAFRLLADLRAAGVESGTAPVLAMDRREALDLRRPIQWLGAATDIGQQLPSPPQHEWLQPVSYWNGGGAAPVWFLADPQRTDIDLIGHGSPTAYRWSVPYPVLMSGVRPSEMDWYRLESPRWYVGEGWALTPEAAGVTAADGAATLSQRQVWIAARVAGQAIAIGGRNFSQATTTVDVASAIGHLGTFTVGPGFFARILPVPPRPAPAAPRFERLDIDTAPGSAIALEQFDASDSRHAIVAFGDGWHEQESNPSTGLRWRWMSNRGELLIAPAHRPVVLRLDGEAPRTYFGRGSRLVIRAADHVVLDQTLSADFSLAVPIAEQRGTVTLETDQAYVPAERSRRTKDRRRLGLRIYRCEIDPVSPEASGPGK